VIRRRGQELTIELLGLGQATCRKQLLAVSEVCLDLVLALALGRALAGSRGRWRAGRSPARGRPRAGANRLCALRITGRPMGRLMGKIVSPNG
jgi:hypothetical protein